MKEKLQSPILRFLVLILGIVLAWNVAYYLIVSGQMMGGVMKLILYAVPFSVFKVDAATDSFANSVAFGPEGTVVATVVLSVSTVLVVLWHRKYASAKGE